MILRAKAQAKAQTKARAKAKAKAKAQAKSRNREVSKQIRELSMTANKYEWFSGTDSISLSLLQEKEGGPP